jgi:site-specific DNA-cytosine methylase
MQPKFFFADLIDRAFPDKAIRTKTLDGTEITLTREAANLDLYVAGFPCTPFSDKGKRGGWQDNCLCTNSHINVMPTHV